MVLGKSVVQRRCLHISLSSDKLQDVYKDAEIDRMKWDRKQFSELKHSVLLRYQETVDLKPAAIKAGLGPIGWHTLRHTFRSWLGDNNEPFTVQREI